ncbi:paREP5 [Pyrobaculum oguniense TE7]|uniref:PaREP5 n=1 Tax=Pyrobaculum oguniense (strain DSM 13380 / JCM 10595 / TE7) TaxID=698757 RepID=H6QA87_PYROT|nr:paREP5 [Pyrobaculum oguniense TE7]
MERLKELIEKELTLEEALLGKLPAGSEYGTPETWKLHLYASIWVGLARKKEAEKEKEKKP